MHAEGGTIDLEFIVICVRFRFNRLSTGEEQRPVETQKSPAPLTTRGFNVLAVPEVDTVVCGKEFSVVVGASFLMVAS